MSTWSGRLIALTALVLVLTGEPAGGKPAEPELRTPCAANTLGALEELAGDKSEIATSGAIFEQVPAAVRAFASRPRKPKSATIFAIPTSKDEFGKIFPGKLLTRASEAEVEKASTLAASSELKSSTSVASREEFARWIKSQTADFIIVAGHNESGKFVFSSGASVSLPLLSEDCARAGKVCVFVSCKSRDQLLDGSIGVRRALTLPEGVWITNQIQRWLTAKKDPVTVLQLASYVRSLETEAHLKYHASYMAFAACAAAGTSAVAYVLIEGVSETK